MPNFTPMKQVGQLRKIQPATRSLAVTGNGYRSVMGKIIVVGGATEKFYLRTQAPKVIRRSFSLSHRLGATEMFHLKT